MADEKKLFDPSTRKASQLAEHEVIDPDTGDKTGWFWVFKGPSHPDAIDLKNAMLRKALKRQRMNKEQSPEEVEAEQTDFLLGRIDGWHGAAVDYSPEQARAYLEDPEYTWLRNWTNKILNDEASFMRTSAKA